jgi:hypothetical protein
MPGAISAPLSRPGLIAPESAYCGILIGIRSGHDLHPIDGADQGLGMAPDLIPDRFDPVQIIDQGISSIPRSLLGTRTDSVSKSQPSRARI